MNSPYVGREQTEAKHFILKSYLQALAFKVLTFSDIAYVDGFSGPWETKTEDFTDSSFMIAISVLRDAQEQYQERTGVLRNIRCFCTSTRWRRSDQTWPDLHRQTGLHLRCRRIHRDGRCAESLYEHSTDAGRRGRQGALPSGYRDYCLHARGRMRSLLWRQSSGARAGTTRRAVLRRR